MVSPRWMMMALYQGAVIKTLGIIAAPGDVGTVAGCEAVAGVDAWLGRTWYFT